MVEITENAYRTLLNTLSDNLHPHSGYGSPPIFYWYRRIILESQEIESCRYLRRGIYQYQLGYSLGIAHVQCEYVGRTRYLIITDYEINTSVLFSWKRNAQEGGMIPKPIVPRPHKPYRRLSTKPLFGYSFVMNDRKEYNLLDGNGNLLTQWFRAIKPLQQPYGKYQIIAYINVGGLFCALGYNGQVYNMNRTWNEVYTENRQILNTELFMNIITEQIDNHMRTNKKVIRLTESDLHDIISESIKSVLTELDWKTYAKAASKSYRQAYDEEPLSSEYLNKLHRGDRFNHAAEKRFNDEFGYSDSDKDEEYCLDIHGERLIGPTSCAWDRSREKQYPARKTFGGYALNAFGNTQYRDSELDPSKSSDKLRDAKKKGDEELDRYYRRNDYQYIKGKGWQ